MTHYFTSDPHLSHDNIRKFIDRPYDNVVEMNEAYMECWNDTVGDNDDVWLLGDLTLIRNTSFVVKEFLDNLRGNIHIVPGNHDHWCFDPRSFSSTKKKQLDALSFAKNPEKIHFEMPVHELVYNKELIVMCHYSMKSWSKKHYGSYQLHGHSHSKTAYTSERQYDVGWDAWYSIPSIDEIFNLQIPASKLSTPDIIATKLFF
jgi:calcineurin-like phosphoesterase family protein